MMEVSRIVRYCFWTSPGFEFAGAICRVWDFYRNFHLLKVSFFFFFFFSIFCLDIKKCLFSLTFIISSIRCINLKLYDNF